MPRSRSANSPSTSLAVDALIAVDPAGASDSIRLPSAVGVAERHEVHLHVVADLSDHHVAGVQPAADREVDPVVPGHVRGQLGDLGLELEGGQARAPRVVLVRQGRAEDRQQAITRELVDRPLERVDRRRRDRQKAIEDEPPALVVQRARSAPSNRRCRCTSP